MILMKERQNVISVVQKIFPDLTIGTYTTTMLKHFSTQHERILKKSAKENYKKEESFPVIVFHRS